MLNTRWLSLGKFINSLLYGIATSRDEIRADEESCPIVPIVTMNSNTFPGLNFAVLIICFSIPLRYKLVYQRAKVLNFKS